MPKIVSRVDVETLQVERLKNMLESYSLGAVGEAGIVPAASDIPGLLDQTEAVLAAMNTTFESISGDLMVARDEVTSLSMRVDELESVVENLLEDISYDEALDHAAADLMDCFAASGSADVTANGELAFDERITFSKEDLKPMLREAITRWIELKLSQ